MYASDRLTSAFTVEAAQRTYHKLNVLYFAEQLPDVEIEICNDLRLDGPRRSRLLGATRKEGDTFHIQLLSGMPGDLWVLKLAHEMIHIKIWPRSHRSQAWRDEVRRLGELGFLSEVI